MIHLDEAKKKLIELLTAQRENYKKLLLVHDLYAKFLPIIWEEKSSKTEDLKTALKNSGLDEYLREELVLVSSEQKKMYEPVWKESIPIEEKKLHLLNRYRSKESWFEAPSKNSLWKDATYESTIHENETLPPVAAFYSFKGGVGRTTALASFAIQESIAGRRVVILDADLDAPGIGTLFSPKEEIDMRSYGIVDYFLEKPILKDKCDLDSYYYRCRREEFGEGEIFVFQAGILDKNYLGKLARLDYLSGEDNPYFCLMEEIRQKLKPNWILIDMRAGLSEPALTLLQNNAHFYVLFGTSSEQSHTGLNLVVSRLGGNREIGYTSQQDCLLVEAMTPSGELESMAKKDFLTKAEQMFSENYYLSVEEDTVGNPMEDAWTMNDIDDLEAPHNPVVIHYNESLAKFEDVTQIVPLLIGRDYLELRNRIAGRFRSERNAAE